MLFSPLKINNLEIKNRISMAPMCMYCAKSDGISNNFHFLHYSTRAMGGAGLITMEATGVEECGKITDTCLGIYDDSHIPGLSSIVKSVHENGAKISIQLAHAGRKSMTQHTNCIYGPTNIPYDENSRLPLAMTEDDINNVVTSFKNAADRARQANFDMVQIHAAHGYLLSSFLSPLSNTRTDSYGGSLQNRTKFLLRVVEAVKKTFDGPLSIRINGYDHVPGGITPEEAAAVINIVKDYGVNIVDISSGAVVPSSIKHDISQQIKYAEIIKQQTNLPVIAGGNLTDPINMDDIIKSNKADMVFLGRELLRNPFFPLHSAQILDQPVDWPYSKNSLKSMFFRY